MKRRTVLRSSPAIAAVALAGCTGMLGGDGDGTTAGNTTAGSTTAGNTTPGSTTGAGDEPTTTVDVATDDAIGTARDHLRAAAGTFGKNAEATDFSQDEFDFETDAIRSSLSKAKTALDRAAASDPTESQRQEIRALRNFRELLSALTSMMAATAAGFEHFSAGQSAMESKRYEAAAGKLADALADMQSAREHLQTARTEASELESTPVPDADWGELGDVTEALDRFDALLGVIVPFTAGYREFALATRAIQDGFSAYENEEFGAAVDHFETARDRFETARGKMERASQRSREVEYDAVGELGADLDRLVCYTGALRDTAQAMVDAAEASQAGNDEAAREAAERARQYSSRCSEDSSDGSSAALRAVERLTTAVGN